MKQFHCLEEIMHFCIAKCIIVSCILFGCGQIKSQETADQHVRIPPWVMEPSADGTVIIGDVDGITVRLASESIRSIAVSSCFGDVSDLPYLSKGDDVYYPEPFCAADGKSIFFPWPDNFEPTEGELQFHIPAGFFAFEPEILNDDLPADIDFNAFMELSYPGAWQYSGEPWVSKGMFSVHDDDTLDKFIPSSGPSEWMTGGYQTVLYPLLESLGLRGNLAMEGQRVGFTKNPPVLNENGRMAKRLQDEKGWEIMCHSMTARFDYESYFVPDLNCEMASEILLESKYLGLSNNNTTSVYDAETNRQYSVNSDKSGWIETPVQYIKPYVKDYLTKKLKMYNPTFPVDYQWGNFFGIAKEHGINASTWVTVGETSSHANVPLINAFCPNGFGNYERNVVNLPPLRSVVTRMPIEGQYFKGYQGERCTDNTFSNEQFVYSKKKIDEAAETGGWIILALHAYRPIWVNKLPGALVSEGGDYPDEWVYPLRDMKEYPDTYLDPPVEKGIEKWSDWYPCPGTRLDMLWQLLKYAQEKGLVNVTSSEGFEKMGNRVSKGYFEKGSKLNNDMAGIDGVRDNYEHFVIGADGSKDYYCESWPRPVNATFFFENGETVGITSPDVQKEVEPIYFNFQGIRLDGKPSSGLYIKVAGSRAIKAMSGF